MVPLIPAGRSEMGYRSVREISFGSGFDIPRVQSGPICARSSTARPSERVPVLDGTEPQLLGPVRVGFCLTEWRSGAIIRIDENYRFPACRCYAPRSAPTAPEAERFGLGSRGRRGGGGALPVARSVPVPLESGRVRRMSGRDSPRDRLDGRERDGGLRDRERLAARRLRLHIPHPNLRRQRRFSAPLRPGPFLRARDAEREPPGSAVRCHPGGFERLWGRDLELDHVELGALDRSGTMWDSRLDLRSDRGQRVVGTDASLRRWTPVLRAGRPIPRPRHGRRVQRRGHFGARLRVKRPVRPSGPC